MPHSLLPVAVVFNETPAEESRSLPDVTACASAIDAR